MKVLNSAREILNSTGLSGAVRTKGWSFDRDGAGLDWFISDKTDEPNLALPTLDGKFATPFFTSTPPRGPLTGEALSDVMRRAKSFKYDGWTDLKWESTRKGPMTSPTPVHKTYPKPYSVTCSHFVGMVLAGYEYNSTTYVVDKNYTTGWRVLYGKPPEQMNIYQSWLEARWMFVNQYMWRASIDQIAPGDILYWCEPDPENSYARARQGVITPYFANNYHVGIYCGGKVVIQSATPTSATGVYETTLTDTFASKMTLAARPVWSPPPGKRLSLIDRKYENRLHSH